MVHIQFLACPSVHDVKTAALAIGTAEVMNHVFFDDASRYNPHRIHVHALDGAGEQRGFGLCGSATDAHGERVFIVNGHQMEGRDVHHDVFFVLLRIVFQSPSCPLHVAEQLGLPVFRTLFSGNFLGQFTIESACRLNFAEENRNGIFLYLAQGHLIKTIIWQIHLDVKKSSVSYRSADGVWSVRLECVEPVEQKRRIRVAKSLSCSVSQISLGQFVFQPAEDVVDGMSFVKPHLACDLDVVLDVLYAESVG